MTVDILNEFKTTVGRRLCDRLGAILRDGIDVHRCLAAQGLGRVGGEQPEAVAALIAALRDEDEDVRSDAATALARLTPPESGTQLLENLIGDPCAEVKTAAVDALVRMRHPEIEPWLLRLLKSRDPDIVWDEEEFHTGGWDDWTDIQLRALAGVVELGMARAVPVIAAAIDDEFGQDLQEAGFAALARLGDAGMAALDGYFVSGGAKIRRRVASALGGTDQGAASATMDRALEDPDPEVRLAAARAIAARRPGDERLIGLFDDPAPEVRTEIVQQCGRSHPDQVVGRLKDDAPAVQLAVLRLVAEAPEISCPPSFVDDLKSRLRSDDENIAALAAYALAAVAPADSREELCALVQDTDRHGMARAGAARALGRIGGDAAESALIAVIGDPDRTLRIAVMTALLAIARASSAWPNVAGEALVAALRGELVAAPEVDAAPTPEPAAKPTIEANPKEDDPSPDTAFPSSTLAAILGDQAPPVAGDNGNGAPVELTRQDIERLALAERMPRKKRVPVTPKVAPHEDVRRVAARLLGDVPHDDVARALCEALDDEDTEVRSASADSLARIGEDLRPFPADVTERLQAALTRADREVRLCALRALGASGGEGSADAVRELCGHDDSFTRAEAVRAVSRLKCTWRETADLLADPDRAVRLAAAQAVAAAGDARALDQLVDFAFSFGGEHRHEAGRLLRGIDAPAASGRFLDVLDDSERMKQWQVAIEALVELNQPRQSTGAGELTS